jgi:hypothetical protein
LTRFHLFFVLSSPPLLWFLLSHFSDDPYLSMSVKGDASKCKVDFPSKDSDVFTEFDCEKTINNRFVCSCFASFFLLSRFLLSVFLKATQSRHSELQSKLWPRATLPTCESMKEYVLHSSFSLCLSFLIRMFSGTALTSTQSTLWNWWKTQQLGRIHFYSHRCSIFFVWRFMRLSVFCFVHFNLRGRSEILRALHCPIIFSLYNQLFYISTIYSITFRKNSATNLLYISASVSIRETKKAQ